MNTDPEFLINEYRRCGHHYAKMRASEQAAEHYRKVLLAILMSHSTETSVAAQEREAYADEQYATHLGKLRAAVEGMESARIDMRAAEYAIEIWRTQQANERMERKAYAA